MLIEEIQWEGPQTIEEVITWGVGPIKGLLETFDSCVCQAGPADEEEDPQANFFYYEFKEKVNRLEKTLYRLQKELKNRHGQEENPALSGA